jgi:cytochrome c
VTPALRTVLPLVALLLLNAARFPMSAAENVLPPNLERGKALYTTCQACHGALPDAPNRGPTLAGILGRRAASVRGFPYSRALKNAKLAWDDAALNAFVSNPQTFLPGTVMPFPGLPEANDRRDLIAFLKTLP